MVDMTELFRSPYTVTTGDINYGGHLGNDRSLILFQDARIRYLASIDLTELNLGNSTALVVVEAVCRFHREVFIHQELEIRLSLAERTGKKIVFKYSVIRKEDGAEVISGQTVHLGFSFVTRKVAELPEDFLVFP